MDLIKQNVRIIFEGLLIILLCFPVISFGSISTRQLYAEVRNETSVSLGDAYAAILNNEEAPFRNLMFYSRKLKSAGLAHRIKSRISDTEKRCIKFKSLGCAESLENLNAALIKINYMERDYEKISMDDKKRFAVAIYADQIYATVLEKFRDRWNNDCFSEKDPAKKLICKSALTQLQEIDQLVVGLPGLLEAKLVGPRLKKTDITDFKKILSKYEKN